MSEKHLQPWKGILLILLSALLSCTGQLFWKLLASSGSIKMLILGALLYGFGALSMMLSFRYGELSVLHPMLSFGYVVSIALGRFVLEEQVSVAKTTGIALIMFGIFMLYSSREGEVKE